MRGVSRLIAILLDIGNTIFFISSFKQMLTAYQNRTKLQGLSSKMLMGYIASTLCFISAGWLATAPLTVIFGILNVIFFSLQLYWKRKYK